MGSWSRRELRESEWRKGMKLRIKGDSLRLRVSRSELDSFLQGEAIAATIHFSPEPDAALTYCLEPAAHGEPTRVHYGTGRIAVLLSEEDRRTWSETNQAGVYARLEIGRENPLELIVEKDYACLDRSDEDNTDTFENPLAGAVC
jgi:hypothetical protein